MCSDVITIVQCFGGAKPSIVRSGSTAFTGIHDIVTKVLDFDYLLKILCLSGSSFFLYYLVSFRSLRRVPLSILFTLLISSQAVLFPLITLYVPTTSYVPLFVVSSIIGLITTPIFYMYHITV